MSSLLAESPPASATVEFTPEDLLRMPGGDRYELVDGKLVERHMGQVSSWVGGEVLIVLGNFVREHKLGWVFPSDCSYQCYPNSPNKVRRPDVSFLRREKLPNGQFFDGHVRVAPDLVVEVLSPWDIMESVETKIAEYQSAGVRSVWVISPKARTCTIHRPNGQSLRLRENDLITEPDLLPGFSCRVGDLLPPPEAVPPLEEPDED
jgi:Uma2 family endonuclease